MYFTVYIVHTRARILANCSQHYWYIHFIDSHWFIRLLVNSLDLHVKSIFATKSQLIYGHWRRRQSINQSIHLISVCRIQFSIENTFQICRNGETSIALIMHSFAARNAINRQIEFKAFAIITMYEFVYESYLQCTHGAIAVIAILYFSLNSVRRTHHSYSLQ